MKTRFFDSTLKTFFSYFLFFWFVLMFGSVRSLSGLCGILFHQTWIRHLHSAVPWWRRIDVPNWSSVLWSALLPVRQQPLPPPLPRLPVPTTITTTCPTTGNRLLSSSKYCRWASAQPVRLCFILFQSWKKSRERGVSSSFHSIKKTTYSPPATKSSFFLTFNSFYSDYWSTISPSLSLYTKDRERERKKEIVVKRRVPTLRFFRLLSPTIVKQVGQ